MKTRETAQQITKMLAPIVEEMWHDQFQVSFEFADVNILGDNVAVSFGQLMGGGLINIRFAIYEQETAKEVVWRIGQHLAQYKTLLEKVIDSIHSP